MTRRRLTRSLGPCEAPPLLGARPVDLAGDRPALAVLFLDAYRGTVDDEGETEADALAAVDALFAGAFGTFDAASSEIVEREGRLVAATLLTRWEGAPFVAFSLTDPGSQRQGLARAGLLRAMAALSARGETRLDLVVTATNDRAVALYERLGFVDV